MIMSNRKRLEFFFFKYPVEIYTKRVTASRHTSAAVLRTIFLLRNSHFVPKLTRDRIMLIEMYIRLFCPLPAAYTCHRLETRYE